MITIGFFVSLLLLCKVDAHLIQNTTFTGDESVGWQLYYSDNYSAYLHHDSYHNTITYYFHPNPSQDYTYPSIASVTSDMADKFDSGADMWNNAKYNTSLSVASLSSVSSSTAAVIDVMKYTSIEQTAAIMASEDRIEYGDHKHIQKAVILINSNCWADDDEAKNIGTCAHEIGHVIGLKDLNNSSNKDKLMYFHTDNRTTDILHASDIKGAAVVSGVHTNHLAGSYTSLDEYHYGKCSMCDHDMPMNLHTLTPPYTSNNDYKHSAKCSVCNGTGTENHNWNTPSYWTSTNHVISCTKCNKSVYPSHGGTFSSINDEEHQKYCSACNSTITQSHNKAYGNISIDHSTANNGHAQTVSCACGWSKTGYVKGGTSCPICYPPPPQHTHSYSTTIYHYSSHPH